jgi:hypothetical protein
MTNFLNRNEVDAILFDLQGQMVSVDFIKKDGTKRKLNGQLVPSPGSHNGHSNLFTIALASSKKDNKAFRSASRDKITRIAGKGKVFAVRSSLASLI